MNKTRPIRLPHRPSQHFDFRIRLERQQRRAADLCIESNWLEARRERLTAKAHSLLDGIQKSCAAVATTHAWRKPRIADSTPRPAKAPRLRETIESPEVVAALADAIEILRLEFSGTEGSGNQTLAKCEKAYRRTRTSRTLILPL